MVGNEIFAVTSFDALPDAERLLFTIALATAVLPYGTIEWGSKERNEPLSRSPQPLVRLGSAMALLAIGFWGSGLNVGWLTGLVAAILLGQVVFDVCTRMQRSEVAGG